MRPSRPDQATVRPEAGSSCTNRTNFVARNSSVMGVVFRGGPVSKSTATVCAARATMGTTHSAMLRPIATLRPRRIRNCCQSGRLRTSPQIDALKIEEAAASMTREVAARAVERLRRTPSARVRTGAHLLCCSYEAYRRGGCNARSTGSALPESLLPDKGLADLISSRGRPTPDRNNGLGARQTQLRLVVGVDCRRRRLDDWIFGTAMPSSGAHRREALARRRGAVVRPGSKSGFRKFPGYTS